MMENKHYPLHSDYIDGNNVYLKLFWPGSYIVCHLHEMCAFLMLNKTQSTINLNELLLKTKNQRQPPPKTHGILPQHLVPTHEFLPWCGHGLRKRQCEGAIWHLKHGIFMTCRHRVMLIKYTHIHSSFNLFQLQQLLPYSIAIHPFCKKLYFQTDFPKKPGPVPGRNSHHHHKLRSKKLRHRTSRSAAASFCTKQSGGSGDTTNTHHHCKEPFGDIWSVESWRKYKTVKLLNNYHIKLDIVFTGHSSR